MKINNLGYLIKEGFHGIFLHGFMSFAAICVTIACLLIVGSFSILAYNLDVMVEKLNQTSEIMVYIDSSLSDAEARSVGTKINQLDNVQNSVFVTREEALEKFVNDHDNNAAFNGVQAQDLRHRYVVTLEDNTLMKQTDEQLKSIPGVAKTNAAYELAEGFTTLQNVLNLASVALIAMLLVISLLIISNTIKLAMYDRKDEIAIMKMVGATNSFIRLPFVVEGFTLGMIGAILAFGLEWVLYDALVERINSVDALRLFDFVPFTGDLLIPMLATFGAAGLFVGIVGSWTSIRKFMDV
ncbi:MAG: permease-like cell division protein FtsX [Candidatus Faecousia sp.]|nr:permease-like cell division protein FtsX [Candidatus Faecousia sp.]